jgi:hypothetical protein
LPKNRKKGLPGPEKRTKLQKSSSYGKNLKEISTNCKNKRYIPYALLNILPCFEESYEND